MSNKNWYCSECTREHESAKSNVSRKKTSSQCRAVLELKILEEEKAKKMNEEKEKLN